MNGGALWGVPPFLYLSAGTPCFVVEAIFIICDLVGSLRRREESMALRMYKKPGLSKFDMGLGYLNAGALRIGNYSFPYATYNLDTLRDQFDANPGTWQDYQNGVWKLSGQPNKYELMMPDGNGGEIGSGVFETNMSWKLINEPQSTQEIIDYWANSADKSFGTIGVTNNCSNFTLPAQYEGIGMNVEPQLSIQSRQQFVQLYTYFQSYNGQFLMQGDDIRAAQDFSAPFTEGETPIEYHFVYAVWNADCTVHYVHSFDITYVVPA